MDKPRGFYVMTVRNNALFAVPVIIKKELQMMSFLIQNFIHEKKDKIT